MDRENKKRKEIENVLVVVEDLVRRQRQQSFLLLSLAEYFSRRRSSDDEDDTTMVTDLLWKIPEQIRRMDRLIRLTDTDCVNNLRMDRNCFGRLCLLLRERMGLKDRKFTVSRYIHEVLRGVIGLHEVFMAKPTPMDDDCDDPRWKWFKGCLGALDGTYIDVRVSVGDAPRYRTRKGHIATNTLAVCDRFMRFVYVLTGWEGSAGDSRVLRDAVTREVDKLRVPKGCYYLCDNGYANSEGFLTPFKGVRYHLKEWGPSAHKPQNPTEMFNMRHTMARNIIERAFAVLKMRWGILRSASFYPITTQTRLIMACFILHNFIRSQMQVDPVELELSDANVNLEDLEDINGDISAGAEGDAVEYVDAVESTPAWNQTRTEIAEFMWNNA
ncbi:uncharacterized protein LOC121785850 [Salvia splendens]|uniref:uncharacterized protein LOC121785850 n=1 Tax=Salvia splendens TaxID=180675 RepID=UPI001C26F638|nr:uncharacterized protein LOC121785850 [Salvia splendens]